MREASGLTQRDLARKLGRERSFVGRVELGERRLDVVEFYWVCVALKQKPEKVAAELLREFARLEDSERREQRRPRKPGLRA
jgi:transcriptional regulator with XRE-family HTH domain